MSEKKARWRDPCGARNTEALSVFTGREEPDGEPQKERKTTETMVRGSSFLLRWSTISETARRARRSSLREVENEGSRRRGIRRSGFFWVIFTNLKIQLKKGIIVATEGWTVL